MGFFTTLFSMSVTYYIASGLLGLMMFVICYYSLEKKYKVPFFTYFFCYILALAVGGITTHLAIQELNYVIPKSVVEAEDKTVVITDNTVMYTDNLEIIEAIE